MQCLCLAKFCSKGWIFPSKIPGFSHVGSGLSGNTGIYLPCRVVFFDVSMDRWLSSSSNGEWEVWGVATLEVRILWWSTGGCKGGLDGDRSRLWDWRVGWLLFFFFWTLNIVNKIIFLTMKIFQTQTEHIEHEQNVHVRVRHLLEPNLSVQAQVQAWDPRTWTEPNRGQSSTHSRVVFDWQSFYSSLSNLCPCPSSASVGPRGNRCYGSWRIWSAVR